MIHVFVVRRSWGAGTELDCRIFTRRLTSILMNVGLRGRLKKSADLIRRREATIV